MRKITFGRAIAIGFLMACAAEANAALVGLANLGNGTVRLADIDTSSGIATPAADFTLSADWVGGLLAYHTLAGRFLVTGTAGGAPALAVLDPLTGNASQVAITGLPAGQEKTSGLTYDQVNDRILITFGATASTLENRVAHIGLDGAVVQVSGDLGLGDRDVISFNPASGHNELLDFNGSSPRIAQVTDLFGTPVSTAIGDPAIDGNRGDAVYADTGTLFVVQFDGPNGLLRYDLGGPGSGDEVAIFIGAFAQNDHYLGLAFGELTVVPVPAALPMLLSAVPLLIWRRRSGATGIVVRR